MTKNTKILLTAINARFSHSSLGVRYLLANLKELRELAKLNEYAIATRASDIVESILLEKPSIVTFGLYIWNIELAKEVIKNLKRVRPEIVIIVGGPEISFEYDKSEVYNYVDHVICGEGEHSFYTLCRDLLEGKSREKLVQSELPDLSTIKLPYEEYSDEDIKNRNISVEASRGCPFGCEFCISSLDKRVRSFPLDKFLAALDNLWERGVRKFKFIDRTFNLKFDSCEKILNFFLNKNEEYFLHFEMVPDRLPEKLRGLIL